MQPVWLRKRHPIISPNPCIVAPKTARRRLALRIAGNYTFEATREEVWAAINDPEVLARTIPGCQRLDQIAEHEYESTLKVGLQAVRGVYTGRVKLDGHVPLESYAIHLDGKGSNGFLKGAGTVHLRTDGANTILDYGGEAQIGGTIASIGQRLLDGAAKTLIHQSLKALANQVEARRLRLTESSTEVQIVLAEELVPEAAPPAPALVPLPTLPNLNGVAAATFPQSAAPTWRTITVPPGQGLSESALARGSIETFFRTRPWLPWMISAFLLGYLLGRRK